VYEQPTPNKYNEQKIYHWKGETAHIFLPQSYLHGLIKHLFLVQHLNMYKLNVKKKRFYID